VQASRLGVGIVGLALGSALLASCGSSGALEQHSASPSPSQASGVAGDVVISGGPAPGNQAVGQDVRLTISAAGNVVVSRQARSGTPLRITLAPGQYTISAEYGNAPCFATTLQVSAGTFTPFTVICNIR
jgi:hypothetical protein